jgi:1-acyl-sn-glycerol-3-phosphate acyltransferase
MKLERIISLARLWSKVFYGYEEHGVENIPYEGPCIFGFNHPGKLLGDMFAALAIIPYHSRIPTVIAPEGMYQGGRGSFVGGKVARGEKIAAGILATGIKLAPTIGITRSGDSPAVQNLAMLKELQNGGSIMLAVEGEVSWDGRSNPSRPGAPWMALRSGAPFIPVAVTGSYDVWPRWEPSPKLTGKIIVRVGEPLVFSETVPEWIDDQMVEEAGARIMNALDSLTG